MLDMQELSVLARQKDVDRQKDGRCHEQSGLVVWQWGITKMEPRQPPSITALRPEDRRSAQGKFNDIYQGEIIKRRSSPEADQQLDASPEGNRSMSIGTPTSSK